MLDNIHVPGLHTGMNMAEVVKVSLDEMGILGKTMGFTVDNSGNNGTMLKQLQDDPDVKPSPDMHFGAFRMT